MIGPWHGIASPLKGGRITDRSARLEELLDIPTAEDALRAAEEWVAEGEVRFARLALIRAKSIRGRTELNAEIADEESDDAS
jgi:hypothetical protein